MKDYRKQAHCTYETNYHLVFVVRYRRRVLMHGLGAYALTTMKRVTRSYPEVEILEGKADEDHVHLLVSIPPKYSVSEVVKYFKGFSAHAMRRRFRFIQNILHGCDGIWSDGYFVSTVGIDEQVIRNYIEHQGKEDRGQAMLGL